MMDNKQMFPTTPNTFSIFYPVLVTVNIMWYTIIYEKLLGETL